MEKNRHTKADLVQMQALPLSAKIRMSQERIKDWYEYWCKYGIINLDTGKIKYKNAPKMSLNEAIKHFSLKDNEDIETIEDGQVYVSFSGGKDSTVLKHLVETTVGDVPSLFVNTGLEYPEVQKFAMSQPNVVTVRPEMRFDEVIKKYGYPVISKEVAKMVKEGKRARELGKTDYYAIQKLEGRLLNKKGEKSIYNCEKWNFMLDAPFKVSNQCCDVMKKRPFKKYEKETGRKPYIGTMASESRMRYGMWLQYGCNAFEKKNPNSSPLSFWSENDILQYIKKFNLPYASNYGDIVEKDTQLDLFGKETPKYTTTGANRTGCMFCMFGVNYDGCPNRFQRMKETHPNQYNYCMKPIEDGGLGLAKVLDFIGEDY